MTGRIKIKGACTAVQVLLPLPLLAGVEGKAARAHPGQAVPTAGQAAGSAPVQARAPAGQVGSPNRHAAGNAAAQAVQERQVAGPPSAGAPGRVLPSGHYGQRAGQVPSQDITARPSHFSVW